MFYGVWRRKCKKFTAPERVCLKGRIFNLRAAADAENRACRARLKINFDDGNIWGSSRDVITLFWMQTHCFRESHCTRSPIVYHTPNRPAKFQKRDFTLVRSQKPMRFEKMGKKLIDKKSEKSPKPKALHYAGTKTKPYHRCALHIALTALLAKHARCGTWKYFLSDGHSDLKAADKKFLRRPTKNKKTSKKVTKAALATAHRDTDLVFAAVGSQPGGWHAAPPCWTAAGWRCSAGRFCCWRWTAAAGLGGSFSHALLFPTRSQIIKPAGRHQTHE